MTDSAEAVIRQIDEVPSMSVDKSRGATIQVLLGPEQGTPSFITRRFNLHPGGRIPCHRHTNIEHEQVVLSGEMVLCLDGRERTVKAGDAIFIPAGVSHWYENRASETAIFLCVVPRTDDYQTEWLEPPAEE